LGALQDCQLHLLIMHTYAKQQQTSLLRNAHTFKLLVLLLPCCQRQQPAHVQLRSAAHNRANPRSSYPVRQHSFQVAQ
jgi:hypothetical protein